MSLSAPTPPSPQDPNSVATTQQGFNTTAGTASQAGSAINQQTPFGSLSYTQSGTGPGGVPLYTASTQLSPQQQSILDTLQGQVGGSLNQGAYGSQSPAQAIGGPTSGATQALLGQETSYLQPYFTTQNQQLDTQLRNQGIFPSQTSNPSNPSTWGPYERAMNQTQENQNQSVENFLATAEPQAYQQSVSNYLLPLQTASQEMGLMNPQMVNSSLAQTPQLSIQPANYIGAVANQQQMLEQQYQQQLQQEQATMSGLFGIPTALLGGYAKAGFPGASSMFSSPAAAPETALV
jgi:hypothetical protein